MAVLESGRKETDVSGIRHQKIDCLFTSTKGSSLPLVHGARPRGINPLTRKDTLRRETPRSETSENTVATQKEEWTVQNPGTVSTVY